MPVITSANARILAAKALEARKRNAANRAAELLRLKTLAALPPPIPAPVPAQALPPKPSVSKWQIDRLARVREHLDRIDEMVKAETDPDAIKKLGDASKSFQLQEALLDDRPGPGTKKQPAPPTASRSASHYPQPQPQPIAGPTPSPLTTNDNSLSSSQSPSSDQPPQSEQL